jgi:hypothetical protein
MFPVFTQFEIKYKTMNILIHFNIKQAKKLLKSEMASKNTNFLIIFFL